MDSEDIVMIYSLITFQLKNLLSCLMVDIHLNMISRVGVPQGSILGPLLFIIYINDMDNSLSHSNCLLYADDTVITYSHPNADTLIRNCQSDVKNIEDWFKCNQLQLNAMKTQFIIFGTKQQTKRLSNNVIKILVKDTDVAREKNVTYLGTKLDENLSWNDQAESVANKIARCLGQLCSVKHLMPVSIRKCVFLVTCIATFDILL